MWISRKKYNRILERLNALEKQSTIPIYSNPSNLFQPRINYLNTDGEMLHEPPLARITFSEFAQRLMKSLNMKFKYVPAEDFKITIEKQ